VVVCPPAFSSYFVVEILAVSEWDSVQSGRFLAATMRRNLWRRFFGYAVVQGVLLTLLAYFLVFVFVSSPQGLLGLLILCAATLLVALRCAWLYADLRTALELRLRALEDTR
jgi:hypothetical protein